jgi:hypothetical protein
MSPLIAMSASDARDPSKQDSGHEFLLRNITQGLTPVQRMLADREASMRLDLSVELARRRRRWVKGVVTAAAVCALMIVWSTTIVPDVAEAQAACNVTDALPEVLDVRIVGSRLVRLYLWPSTHIFYIETASAYFATTDEKQVGTHCFTSEPLSGDQDNTATVQLRDPEIAANATFEIRVFWADLNQGPPLGRAGDIIAARCVSINLTAQTKQCGPWRKMGFGYKLFSDWPPDWR